MYKLKYLAACSSLAVLATAAYSTCWKLIPHPESACDLAWCEVDACNTVTRTIDEVVYLKVSDVPGRDAVSINALCKLDYKVPDKYGWCNDLDFCEGQVGSWVLTGGLCPTSIE